MAQPSIKFEDAVVERLEFSGEPTDFNQNGDIRFRLILSPEDAEALREQYPDLGGLKSYQLQNGTTKWYLQVKIHWYKSPKIYKIVGDRRTRVAEKYLSELMDEVILTNDISIDIYYWSKAGRSGHSARLNTWYCVCEKEDFSDKWAKYQCDDEEEENTAELGAEINPEDPPF